MGAAVDEAQFHADRQQGIGGSDAPAIMGVSPWTTPHQLWLLKTGRVAPQAPNAAMQRGTRMEEAARAAYIQHTRTSVIPAQRVHPEHAWMRANLDGISESGEVILEVKCPGAEAHGYALKGEVPPCYYPQVQHYLACVPEAKVCAYWSYDGNAGVLVLAYRNEEYIAKLIAAERVFWDMVVFDTPPPLTDCDVVAIEDPDAIDVARRYAEAEGRKAEAEGVMEACKKALVARMGPYPKVTCGPLALTKYESAGRVDYKKVPQLKGVDLEPYRGKPTEAVRVSVLKGID